MRSILILGPPGSGKFKLAGELAAELGDSAPFRAPHHSVSEAGLLGLAKRGESSESFRVYPGEATLANSGSLFLDELTDFRRSAVECLGHALKSGVHRLSAAPVLLVTTPALLVASSNVCACGRLGTPEPFKPCTCRPEQLARWNARLVEYCDLLGIQEIQAVQFRTTLENLRGADRTP